MRRGQQRPKPVPKKYHSTYPRAKSPVGLPEGSMPPSISSGKSAPCRRREDCPKHSGESGETVCTGCGRSAPGARLAGLDHVNHIVVLYWMSSGASRSRDPSATLTIRSVVAHFPPLAGAAQPDCGFGRAAGQYSRQRTFGGQARLCRRHAAPRSEAVFRFPQNSRPGCFGWLARCNQALKRSSSKSWSP